MNDQNSGNLPFADDLLSSRSRAWVKQQADASSNSTEAGSPTSDNHQPRIAGYRVGRRIGRGGMGTVYECSRDGSAERFAVKIISTGQLAGEEERRRFMLEIGMLLRLHHPHISRLRDFGQDGAAAWFVMDFIDGQSFGDWLVKDKPDRRTLATLLGHAARAVAHAHRQGIIHRDLNPANLMVLPDGHPVIMDFGLGRDLAADEALTISGMTVGTPPYMSPEQTLGTKGSLSIRTDVWGMGGILYCGLTGRAPFSGASNHEIFTKINEQDPVPPRAIDATIPPALERIALRCLQRDQNDRYPDLDALAVDLERFVAGQRVMVRLPGLITRLRRRVKRHPLPWILATALVLTGIGVVGYAAVERLRRLAAWTDVVDVAFSHGSALPAGLTVRDGFFQPLVTSPVIDQRGLGPVIPTDKSLPGWWWFEGAGLQGGVRLEIELDMPIDDALEIAVNASSAKPRESWHHPAGWVAKIQSAEVLSLAVMYQDIPGPLKIDNGFLLERSAEETTRLQLIIDVRDASCTVAVAGSTPVTVSEPLALGGSDRRAIGLRFYNPQTRMRHLRIERLKAPELVSPLAGPDALLRYGRSEEAIAEYRLVAADHPGSAIGDQALLRALAENYRHVPIDNPLRTELYAALRSRGPGALLDEADRIRAVALWSAGQGEVALGVAHDLVARRPELNPVQMFLGDRTWEVAPSVGSELVRLLAATPNSVGVSLADLGLTTLEPLAGRRAWSVNVAGNLIRDLTPVAYVGCTYLNAGRNHISDLTPLAGLKSLVRLTVPGNDIVDVKPLEVLSALRGLDVSNNRITSLAGLPSSIVDLSAAKNPLSSIVGLPTTTLQRLNLSQTPLADLSPLRTALQLTNVDISETEITDLSMLQDLPVSSLRAARARNLNPATITIPALRRLHLAGCPLVTPERLPTAVLENLESLDVSETPTAAWSVKLAPNLQELQLNQCQLTTSNGLSALSGLRRLDLRGNHITEVASLASLQHLTRLDLRDNRIVDCAALLEHPPAILLLTGNPLSQAACQDLITAGRRLQRMDLSWQGASMLSERYGDTHALREVAMLHTGRRYAVYYTAQRIPAETANDIATRLGGRLAVIPDAVINRRLADSLSPEIDPWCGIFLRGGQICDADGVVSVFRADLPPVGHRGYRALPRDGGQVVVLDNGTWGLSPANLASGLIIEWDGGW